MVCPTQKQEKASYVMYLLEQLEQLRQKCEGGYFGSCSQRERMKAMASSTGDRYWKVGLD